MDHITEVKLDHLHESPFNYRKAFSDVDLRELADSIQAEGRVHQPILVRPVATPPLLNGADTYDGYEIVFGHRRYRAAQLAGLASIPCMVRPMTDSEAKRAQIAENLQRVDVHPIEEAEGFQALIDEGSAAADLAAQVGKSISHVYSRLKLLQACPPIRTACLSGEIGSEVALLIARVGPAKIQEKALAAIKSSHYDMEDGGARSFRQIRELLNEKFTLDLKTAPFDIEDEMLVPEAGHCIRCPKRSGNAPEFNDVVAAGDKKNPLHPEYRKPGGNQYYNEGFGGRANVGADVCTDPDCFDAKKRADLKRKAAALEAKGKTVVDGAKARQAIDAQGNVKGAYIALKDVKEQLSKARLNAMGDSTIVPPLVVTIQDPRSGRTVEAVKVEDLKKAGVAVKEQAKRPNYEEERRKREAEHAQLEAKAKEENRIRRVILDHVRAQIRASERTAFDLHLIAPRMFDSVPWQDRPLLADLYQVKNTSDVEKRIGQFDIANLTLFILDCVLVSNVMARSLNLQEKPKLLLQVAKHYGVDVDAIRKAAAAANAEPGSTPSKAARATKGAAAGKPAKKKPGPIKLGDPDAPAEPELSEKQTDDAGSAGGSDAQAGATEEAAS